MSFCGSIYNDIIDNCNDLPPDKIECNIYIINYNDILYVQFDGEDISEIRTTATHKDIAKLFLYGGKRAYRFEGKNNSVDVGSYQFELLYSDVYAHFVDINIFSNIASVKKEIEKLAKGRYVIIIENSRHGNHHYEVYGLYSGLILIEKERVVNDDEVSSYFLSFESDVESPELHAPHKYLGDISWLTTDHWILWDGWWDNSGIWMDTEVWED